MATIGPGRIFWAIAPGERGGGKSRPMIVVSRQVDIIRTGQVFVVVCSTDFEPPVRDHEVELPHDTDRKSITGLPKPTVAVCNWTTTYSVVDIRETAGLIPAHLLREIRRKAGIDLPPER